ncbi:addiction module protein [uncultured Thiodictyon sp.]|uniref:addiction module protein n=1 Tax=uncultured Thiodictyon sp. TaxID=1846217 RepID=UPI0025F21ED6|nr:addiction module protein [uncultured Thiodictyon sp.]
MMIELPLAYLALEEKLQLMESLWDDLCRQDNGIESPSWHEDLLAQRESAITQGTEQFTDWETAKRTIRSQLT